MKREPSLSRLVESSAKPSSRFKERPTDKPEWELSGPLDFSRSALIEPLTPLQTLDRRRQKRAQQRARLLQGLNEEINDASQNGSRVAVCRRRNGSAGRKGYGAGVRLVAARAPSAPPISQGAGLWAENFVSGATASSISKLVLQPFDTTKTILQGAKQVRGDYRNFAECAWGVIQKSGVRGLYRGFFASITVSAPSSAVFFSTYEFVKKGWERLCSREDMPLLRPLSRCAPIIAAALGNCVSSCVRVPPEVLKQRVQAGLYKNMLEAIVTMWKAEGIRGFYTGYTTMLARDIPYAAIQFMSFEALKRRRASILKQRGVDEKLSPSEHVLSNLWMGAVAGGIASTMTLPLDVVKTRVMTQSGAAMGMRSTIMRMWAEEGIVAFGRGLVPRVLYKVPSSALFLVCYEGIRRLFRTARKARLKRKERALRMGELKSSNEAGSSEPLKMNGTSLTAESKGKSIAQAVKNGTSA